MLPQFADVGCYTTPDRKGCGEGLGVYRIAPATGASTQIQLAKGLGHPSWLTLDRRARAVADDGVAVNEDSRRGEP